MAPLSQRIRFCTSRDGTRIAFSTCGSGPPLVWPARFMSHLKAEWDSPVWRPWIELLARRHTLIRYDTRGVGLSDRKDIVFSLPKFMEDLDAVVETTGAERFVMAAIGGGSGPTITYVARHPERVSHLVLFGGYSRGRITHAATPEQAEEVEATLKLTAHGWDNDNPAFRNYYTSQWIVDSTPEQFHSFGELIRQSTNGTNAANILRIAWSHDLREAAQLIRCPTLVLHASDDAMAAFDEGRALSGLIPGARFIPLESRNHLVLDHEPAWAQLVTALDEFLPAPADPRYGATTPLLDELTAREHQVLELLAQGLDNDTIAGRLGTSEKTVRNQVSIIFGKLGVTSRAQAVVHARDAGFGREQSI